MNELTKDKDILQDIDTCIENMREAGLDDKMIALNLSTAAGLVKTKKWDDFYAKK